jgi:hypothetical protein
MTKANSKTTYFPPNGGSGNYFGIVYELNKNSDGSYKIKGSLDKNNDIFTFHLSKKALSYDASKVYVKYRPFDEAKYKEGVDGKDFFIDGIGTLDTAKEMVKVLFPSLYAKISEIAKHEYPYGKHIPVDEFKMTFLKAGFYYITFKEGAFTTADGQKSTKNFTLVIKVKDIDDHAKNHDFNDGLVHIYKNFKTPPQNREADPEEAKRIENIKVFENSADFGKKYPDPVKEKKGDHSDIPPSGSETDDTGAIGLLNSSLEADYAL